MKALFPIVFILVSLSPAYGEWTQVRSNERGDKIYLDYERLKLISDNIIRVWTRVELNRPEPIGISKSINYEEHDCQLGRMRFLQDQYDLTNISSERTSPPPKWLYHLPDSAGEVVHKEICNRKNMLQR